jgi:hypothetical protein
LGVELNGDKLELLAAFGYGPHRHPIYNVGIYSRVGDSIEGAAFEPHNIHDIKTAAVHDHACDSSGKVYFISLVVYRRS